MTTLRRKPARAGVTAAVTLLIVTCAALPAAASAEPVAPGGGAVPQLAFNPPSYDFGLQQVNSGSAQTGLQLRNEGEVATPVTLNVVGGSGTFQIAGSDCYGRMLNPGESCSVQVSFGPYNASPFTAELRATAEGGVTFTADLSGEGGRAIFALATDPTNFGSVAVGSAGVTRTIDVSNVGNMPGGAFIAVISGGAVGSFHLLDENCTGILLTPAATCNMQVSFQPLSTGSKTARLSLFGEQDGGTQIVLSGVGLEPEVKSPADPPSTNVPSSTPDSKQRARSKSQRRRSLRRGRHRRLGLASLRATG